MTEIATTKSEREIMKHSLGLDYKAKSFRNYFNAEEGHGDMPYLKSLVEKGFMVQRGNYFFVTEAGMNDLGISKKDQKALKEKIDGNQVSI